MKWLFYQFYLFGAYYGLLRLAPPALSALPGPFGIPQRAFEGAGSFSVVVAGVCDWNDIHDFFKF